MPREAEFSIPQAIRRIYSFLAVLTILGTLVAFLWRGSAWGLGFLAGAGVSLVNFTFFDRLAHALSPGGEPLRRGSKLWLILRLLLIGAAGFVILKASKIVLTAVLFGLLASAAAVILEILYELIYARI